MPNQRRNRGAALALLGLGLFIACSDDETPPPPLPEGPPRLEIASIQAPGQSAVVDENGNAGCFAIDDSCTSSASGPSCGFVVVLRTDRGGRIPLLLPDGSLPRFWNFP